MEILEIVQALERDFPARLFSTLETNAWPHLKNRIAMASVSRAVRLETGNSRRLFSIQGLSLIARSLAHVCHIAAHKRGRPAFFGASTGIAIDGADGFKDYYFPYYDLKPQDCQYFVNCGNIDHLARHTRYLSANHVVVENYLIAPWRKILGAVISRLPCSDKAEFKRMSSALAEHRVGLTVKQLRATYAEFIAGTLLYSLLLRLTKPNRVYVVSAYSKADLVAAARRRRLRIIEIQHGILGRFHHGYTYADEDSRLGTPNQIDVYNEFWKDELSAGGFFVGEQIRVVGRLKYAELPPPEPSLARTIVFTGQAAYQSELLTLFKQWNDTLAHQGYQLLYIPHPKETTAERATIRQHLDSLSSVSLYDGPLTTEHLIKSAAAHLSLFSACHFDSVHLVGRTFVLRGAWSQFMKPYIDLHPNRFIGVDHIGEVIEQLSTPRDHQIS